MVGNAKDCLVELSVVEDSQPWTRPPGAPQESHGIVIGQVIPVEITIDQPGDLALVPSMNVTVKIHKG